MQRGITTTIATTIWCARANSNGTSFSGCCCCSQRIAQSKLKHGRLVSAATHRGRVNCCVHVLRSSDRMGLPPVCVGCALWHDLHVPRLHAPGPPVPSDPYRPVIFPFASTGTQANPGTRNPDSPNLGAHRMSQLKRHRETLAQRHVIGDLTTGSNAKESILLLTTSPARRSTNSTNGISTSDA